MSYMMTWLARWRRPVGVGVAIALVAVIGGTAAASGSAQADQLVTVLGVIPLAAAALAWALRPDVVPTQAQLDEAASALARHVRYQWQTEAAARGLLDPRPLGVGWAARYDIADHRKNAGSIQTGRSDEIASFGTRLLELPRRRLVIAGDPGSGKTSLAVLLTLALLDNPARGELVPVLASVASWDPSQERLAAWLIRRIELDYRGLQDPAYGTQAARELLRAGRVLPVLDGLDELPEPVRASALEAINRELPAASPLVLTCRTAEYLAAVRSGDVLTGAALVQAEPVRPAQVANWLRSGIPPHRLPDWKPVFRQLRQQPDGPLAQALRTPLAVWLIRSVYRQPGRDPAELTDVNRFATPDAIRDYLLDALIPALVSTDAATASGPAAATSRRRVRGPSHPAQEARREDLGQGLRAAMPVPSAGRDPPAGLDPGRQPRRHHHRLTKTKPRCSTATDHPPAPGKDPGTHGYRPHHCPPVPDQPLRLPAPGTADPARTATR
jgi:NACHT domain-containing protein